MEKHTFQAEIQQLLSIVIHSLYTDKEIFVRELVSNAADAMEKLRFYQSSGTPVRDEGLPLRINLTTDETAKTITITDAGIGMNHEELVQNLGTIARSGSKEFLKQLAEGQQKRPELIGQFGVGFYSAFMVASEVTVYTRSYRTEDKPFIWRSTGAGSYEIEEGSGIDRGTKIVIKLRDADSEFATPGRIEGILRRYSSFVQFPIELNGKVVNTVQALWTRNKSEIKPEEYKEFYQFAGHDHEDPRYHLHFTADAPISIQALLFVPKTNMEKFGFGRMEPEVHLYCRKVLIQSKAEGLLPIWLRFLRGVVDSEDLPLNISRETMQDSALVQKLNKVLTGRMLKLLEEESSSNPEGYKEFYNEFGGCLKEGVATDFAHRDALAKLLRFESSSMEAGKWISLSDVVSRLGADTKEIYYLLAPHRAAAEASPYLEGLKAKGHEVLFLFDPRDEFVMNHLREFDGKKLVSAEKASVALDKATDRLSDDDAKSLVSWMKEVLGERIQNVVISERLVGSPAVVVDEDPNLTSGMRRMMKAMEREQSGMRPPEEKRRLEINTAHAIIRGLSSLKEGNPDLGKIVAHQLVDGALLASGVIEEPQSVLSRMNALMEKAVAK